MASKTTTSAAPPNFEVDVRSGERVVISGMSGLFPDSRNVKDLSNILYNKINPIRKTNRWQYNHPEVPEYIGNVAELSLFDAQFFKVHYRQANNMDVMARKILEQAYQAIYDAGISPADLNGKKVGVYIGSCFSETEKVCCYAANLRTGFGVTGCNKAMFANRISYWLNAKGPSMSIDEACSSSIGALEVAYHAIRRGECEAAIVGGGSLCLHPQSSIHHGRIMQLSMDDKTKSFDTDAEGCTKSEAVNVLFLQKAKDALRVYAEVKHVKCEFISLLHNETGPKYGFYRNPSTTADFIKRFYKEANISPESIEYVEAFGSAIPEADKAELEAIEDVFCNGRNDPLLIGTVMSNIGYSEAGSGISAIIKVLLGYHTGKIAANLHCESPRQDVAALRDGRMRIVTENQRFRRTYTAVNGLSFSGINTHVLLHGQYKPKDPLRYKTNIPQLITLSGRQESAVRKILEDLKSRPIDYEELALLRNIHKTSIVGHVGRGYAILGTNEFNETVSLCEKADYFDDMKRPLWFVYSGMGSQWAGMGTHLMRIPVFAAAIERCHRALSPKGIDIVHIITSPDKNIFDNILNSFVGIAAVQIGLTDVLKELGLRPDKIIGHSVGELGCAYADGCFTAEEMILSAYSRGLVSLQTPFIKGSMAAVGIGYQEVSKMCPPEIEVACHNGPDSSTISGPANVMKEFVSYLTTQEIFAKEVPCSNIAYHSRYIAEAGPGLLKCLREVIKTPKPRSERWVSTSVPQERWNEPIAKYSSAEYHTNNLLSSVLFDEASSLIPSNAVIVEIAPHGLLQAILKRSLPDSCRHVPLTRRGHQDNVTFLLQALGILYMHGYNPRVEALYPKVEYPVSTGTPMLSHLVEWAHTERWNVPLYAAARRQTAAACKYIISTHDDESAYLKGHCIRDKNIYPFSAVLVSVWDTLAMVMGEEKKQLSVEFRDVFQHSPLVLHNQRQLRLNIDLQRGTGRFEVLSESVKIATGYIIGNINSEVMKIKEDIKLNESMVLKSQDIYQLLYTRDYNYSGDFRSIHNANMSFTEANILWRNNWVTVIDGMLQLNALRRTNETVSQPYFISKININVENHLDNKILLKDESIAVPAQIDMIHDCTRCGGILIENIRFYDMPPINRNISLKALQFVPQTSKDSIDILSALCVLLQVVAKNLNKRDLRVVDIIENNINKSEFEETKKHINDIPEIRVQYEILNRQDISQKRDFLANVDLLVVRNLSVDDNINQIVYQVRSPKSFLINYEKYGDQISSTRPSTLYRSVCAHTINSMCVELVLWRPTDLKGIWEGEYYLPLKCNENLVKGRGMALDIKQYGDLDSLHWIEETDSSESGVNVTVHYVGINDVEVKKKMGTVAFDNNNIRNFIDFSGKTQSGVRVMGISYDESIKTRVKARPEMLWPVPEHWSLEDAATVPLAYCLAFYCLSIKSNLKRGSRLLVHGGAGALGQAVISIALAHDCEVFTTVSDIKKKRFLQRLFPELKEDHIGNSRDISFGDMVLNATKGEGCNIILSCVQGELKNVSIKCTKLSGWTIDTTVLLNREKYDLGMQSFIKGMSYITIDLQSIEGLKNKDEWNKIQRMLSEGIARGYVRPLSRIMFAPQDVSRAYRLHAGSRHCGRVLLNLQDDKTHVQAKMSCSPNLYQFVVLENELLGLQLVERLIKRGAKKIILICSKTSNCLYFKIRAWTAQGVLVEMFDINILSKTSVADLFDNFVSLGDVESVYYVLSTDRQINISIKRLEQLVLISQRFLHTFKYFAVISSNSYDDWRQMVKSKPLEKLLTWIQIPALKTDSKIGSTTVSIPSAVEAIEQALCSNQRIIFVQNKDQTTCTILKGLTSIAGIDISERTPKDMILKDLGIHPEKFEAIRVYMRDFWNVSLCENDMLSLTINTIRKLGDMSVERKYEDTEGLKTFISYIDTDELLATTEIIFLPSLTNLSAMREDELNISQVYMCVVPGVEGHHARFQDLCERIKLSTIVLQPGLDRMHETIQDTADHFAKILLKKTQLKNEFYLLGYESGVLVALEMAAILEDHGLTGTVFCIGGAPDDIKKAFEEKLNSFKTEEELQDAVVRHMYTLMTNESTERLDNVLKNTFTWGEKVIECVKLILSYVLLSNQYTKQNIEAAYARILQVRNYNGEPRRLRSKIISIKPLSGSAMNNSTLQNYSVQPIVEYELQAPLAYAAEDLQCSAIVNRHLDHQILETFDKKNLCETYNILNAGTIMMDASNHIDE